MTNSRRKGDRYERDIAAWLRSLGFPSARRGQQHRGGPDSPDVLCDELEHLFFFEGKHVEKFSIADLYAALDKARREAPDGAVPVVSYKRNHHDDLIILRREDFGAVLVSHYHNQGE